MQLNTLFTLACALLVSGVSAWNPAGQPCRSEDAGAYGCSNEEPTVNNGDAFVYVCDGRHYQISALCGGHTSCEVSGRNAFCT
ncbi:hypothetical protein CYLTODRAFT_493381 [Cylindrobasidium torrendii FP15055 ss-10]|uniref:Carbohydrate-binding module family 19 domain-containing protein n=1 Tax=Cylindrobasidium torrendii FP15055 ss-10 TaxID=1314674 RepID=A0A0D7B0U6_9AGAR|nr:hypothetical protein CYLTODRAFT_493381 [Cylindrobasidium torrendii FP15055 ss-10]